MCRTLCALFLVRRDLLAPNTSATWEVATTSGLAQFSHYRGRFHVLRRPLPTWLAPYVLGRFRRLGLGVLPNKGALDRLLACLAAGDAVVFMLDQ